MLNLHLRLIMKIKELIATNWVAIFALIFASFAAAFTAYKEINNSISRDKVDLALSLLKLDSLNSVQKERWTQTIKESAFKEDLYLTQLEVQSNQVVLYVSILFGIFGIVGYTVFYKEMNDIRKEYSDLKNKQTDHVAEIDMKIRESEESFEGLKDRTQNQMDEYNANIQKSIEEFKVYIEDIQKGFMASIQANAILFEDDIKTFKEGLNYENSTFKNDVQADFEEFANGYDIKYRDLRTGLYIQSSNLLFMASKNYQEKKEYIDCLSMTSEGLKYQIELLKEVGSSVSKSERILVMKNHLENSIGFIGQIIQDKELKTKFKNSPNYKFVVDRFNDMLNYQEFRDQLIDILGLLKMVLDEPKDTEPTKNDE